MKSKIIISIVTFILLAAPLLAKYSGGDGSESAPWQISDANDLLYLADHYEDYNSHFILTADIDLSGYKFTTAVIAPDTNNVTYGFQGTTFTGKFNGNNFTMRNLEIDTGVAGNDYLGLFGSTDSCCEIRNLGIVNVRINGGNKSELLGALVGLSCESIIRDSFSTGVLIGLEYSYSLGGLVGYSFYSTISNCYSKVSVTGGYSSAYLGGLAGGSYYGSINNCYSIGDVNGGDNSVSLGGLVGENVIQSIITNCYAKGSIKGGYSSEQLGGLVGYNSGTISNSYAIGNVVGEDESDHIGGLVAWNYFGTINNCFSTGLVDGEYLIGGFVGVHWNGYIISNCFWDTQTSGLQYGVGYNYNGTITNLLGKTTAEMHMQSTFTDYGWDFLSETVNGTDDYWKIREGYEYPRLSWQLDILGDFVQSYIVNFADYVTMANAWLSTPFDDNWNKICDLYPDDVINSIDLQILVEHWLEE